MGGVEDRAMKWPFTRRESQVSPAHERKTAEHRLDEVNKRIDRMKAEAAVITLRFPKNRRAD